MILVLLFCTQVQIPETDKCIFKQQEHKNFLTDWGELLLSLNEEKLRSKLSTTDPNQTEYVKERNLILADTNKLIADVEDKIDYWQSLKNQTVGVATICRFGIVILGAALVISGFLNMAQLHDPGCNIIKCDGCNSYYQIKTMMTIDSGQRLCPECFEKFKS